MALFAAYFDASGNAEQQDSFLVVSGYIANYLQWRTFEDMWPNIHAQYGVDLPFHMSSFMAATANPDRYSKQKDARQDYVAIARDNRKAQDFFKHICIAQQSVLNCGISCMIDMKVYNQVRSLLDLRKVIPLNRGVQRKKKLWTEAGRQQLQSFVLPPWATRRRDHLLALLTQWDTEIAELDRVVLAQAHAHPEAAYLMQRVCGVGPITALATVLTLGPVTRFANARKVASYVGLIPAEDSSGGHQRSGSHHQAELGLLALRAGGSRRHCLALRCRVQTRVLATGGAACQAHRQGRGRTQTAHTFVLVVAPAEPAAWLLLSAASSRGSPW